MLLASQNKSLAREMLSFKRELADARKELELMRLKSREMEGLVGAIQRGWSQVLFVLRKFRCKLLIFILHVNSWTSTQVCYWMFLEMPIG